MQTKIQINVIILYLFLGIIASLIGYGIYLQHQLNKANQTLLNEKLSNIDAENKKYKDDLITIADSLIKIRTIYKTIEVDRKKENEKINKINSADSIAIEFNHYWSSRSRKQ